MTFEDVVICSPLRTPVGRFGGAFRSLHAHELGAGLVSELVRRAGLPGEAVEDVLFAQCYPSMDAPALGRVVALDAGLAIETTGLQIDRRCGSGLQAVIYGAMQVASGAMELVIAGGAESMSNAPLYSTSLRWGIRGNGGVTLDDALGRGRVTAGGKHFPVDGGMLETAENVRRDHGVTRAAQDALAEMSHARAVSAQAKGRFAAELVAVTVPGRKGDTHVAEDEHPRPETTMESLAALKPILGRDDPDATVTAGNASGQNDGAAACIIASRAAAERHGLKPMGRLVGWSLAGVAPKTMGIGPVPAVGKLLEQIGLRLADIDLIELNEAFASQVLACSGQLGLTEPDFDRINVNGSGISLGHPVGATGARILATLLHEMERREARYGLETMCIGGGQGLAAVFERVS